MDLTYDIFGREAFVEEMSVVMVKTVVTPSMTLAGVAPPPLFSQKDTHEITTIRDAGM